MDTGEGRLRMLDEDEHKIILAQNPGRTDIFTVGEIVTVKDSRFKISKITPKKITLRILPKD